MHQLRGQVLPLGNLWATLLVVMLVHLFQLQRLLTDLGLSVATSAMVRWWGLVLVLWVELFIFFLCRFILAALLLLTNLPDPGKASFRVSRPDSSRKLGIILE